MSDQDEEKQLEELLDSMLSRYSAVEPRPGLETRVIARIAAADCPRSHGGVLRWLWAGATAAAVVAIVVAGFFARPAARPVPAPDTTQMQPPPVSGAPTAPIPHSNSQPRQVSRMRRPLPQRSTVAVRQEVFPTPVPLSEQEALLLRYLSRTPRQELIVQSHPDPLPDDGPADDGSALFPGMTNQRFGNQ